MARLKTGKPANTFSVLLEVAHAMDDAGHDGGGHATACLNLAACLPHEVDGDTDAAMFIDLCEANVTAFSRSARSK